jgi:hypothetical protein
MACIWGLTETESILFRVAPKFLKKVSHCWKVRRLRFLLRAVMKTEMGMEHWRNDADRRKPMYSERNLLITLCPLQTPHENGTDSIAGRRGERSATNRLGHGTVFEPRKNSVVSVGCTRVQPTDTTRTQYTKCRL